MTNKFPHPFRELEKNLKALKAKLPMKVSGIAEEDFKENFRRQGVRGNGGNIIGWKKRKNESEKRKGRALLIKSGRLRRGFKKRPDANNARVINDVPYAQANNEGNKETVSVKAFTRRSRRTKKISNVKAHSRKNNLDARSFMITTEPLLKDISEQMGKDVDTIFKSLK
jgi:phage gpG-like protein